MKSFLKIAALALLVSLTACNRSELNTRVSNTTGWNYYDQQTTNFQAKAGVGNVDPVGMVPIQGGTFSLGQKDEFLTAPHNNSNRTVTVSSFYMDKYEITNLNWNEYLHWLDVVFGTTAPELVKAAQPDHDVWLNELAYNDPYVQNYFDHPAFSFYPIVGVTWEQADAYCRWRTDRVNEAALINAGAIAVPNFAGLRPVTDEGDKDEWELEHPGYIMAQRMIHNPDNEEDPTDSIPEYFPPFEWVRDHFVFNTEKYLMSDNYNPDFGRRPFTDSYGENRKVNRADGILVTGYRLPTEAEFEFAAYAPVAGEDGLTVEGKVYPWSGYHPRDLSKVNKGKMQANFVRGRGDMMGVSGDLNDGYVITGPVDAFMPNDFGLYNIAGNVNEWVLDVYRETTNYDVTEYNSFRGNIYSRPVRDANGGLQLDSLGCIVTTYDPVEDDKRNYLDGDSISIIDTDYPLEIPEKQYALVDSLDDDGNPTGVMVQEEVFSDRVYLVDPTDVLCPRITKKTRVYKGGSWADRIYWLNPSSRRYLDQDKCSATIGFRCAMSTLGDQIPNTPMKR